MITPSGETVYVTFSETEVEWISAAVTLPLRDREAAYADIAAITGRKIASIRDKGKRIMREKRDEARGFLHSSLRSRRIFVPADISFRPSAAKKNAA